MWLVAKDRLKGMSKRGTEYDFLCPWHDDSSQSFQIYQEDDGFWLGHCKACNCGGEGARNVFQLVMKTDNVNFPKAVDIVRRLTEDEDWAAKRANAESVFRRAISDNKEVVSADLKSFEPYMQNLRASEPAMTWLRNRGFTLETIEQFNLGFVQKPHSKIVPTNHPWADKGWILFPEIRKGRVVAVKYRSLMGKRLPKTETTQAWSGFAQRKDMAKSPMFNIEAINPLDAVLVTEGEPDAIVLAQAGFVAVSLPSAGYNATPEMRDALMAANARYMAGDTDECGSQCMQKLHKELGGDSPNGRTYLLQWPKPFKDANEFFLNGCGGNIGHFREEVTNLMDSARSNRLAGIRDMKEVMRHAKILPSHDNPRRLHFPWSRINKWVDILPGEVMYVFATETKMGKSTWVENILDHNVLNFGKRVINFSAELSYDRYAAIVAAHLLGVNRATLTEEQFRDAAELLPEESFFTGYKPGAKWADVVKLLEDAKQTYGGDIFVVDPLHFILRGHKAADENTVFAAAMKDMVDFSIKWDVIVIVVGMARKSMQGARGKMAQGQDSRGTAALGEDAATTWILHRNRIASAPSPDEEDEPVFENVMKVKLDYSRNSEPKSMKLNFDGGTASFVEQAPKSLEYQEPVQQADYDLETGQ